MQQPNPVRDLVRCLVLKLCQKIRLYGNLQCIVSITLIAEYINHILFCICAVCMYTDRLSDAVELLCAALKNLTTCQYFLCPIIKLVLFFQT